MPGRPVISKIQAGHRRRRSSRAIGARLAGAPGLNFNAKGPRRRVAAYLAMLEVSIASPMIGNRRRGDALGLQALIGPLNMPKLAVVGAWRGGWSS